MSFNVGENIGPYRIIEQLGQGGMATVYKAYHASLDRYVALKALHPAFGEDVTFEARFQREARVVAKLEHPHIVPVYDYAEHEKRPYLVMKYIEGDTLKARLSKGPLTSEEINKVVDAVGAALAYAHKQGILHRDIKPSNVLVAADGEMYLADFGLARIAQSGESTLSSDMIMGTPQYISPEQAMGRKELDAGTDIYSFGVMLYEMVVGQVPFSADTPFSIIHDHIYSPLPLPQTINPNVPEPVQRVLLKALAKERADRYVDVTELNHAFKEAWREAGVPMKGTSVTIARPIPSAEKTRMKASEPTKMAAKADVAAPAPSVRKKRSSFIWVGVSLLLVLCVGAVFVARQNRLFASLLGSERQVADVPTVVASVTPNVLVSPTQTLLPPTQPSQPLLPPEVLALQQKAKANPDNPDVQLELALAFWSAKMPGASYDTLLKVINLVGPDNETFYTQAGEKFASIDGWLPAAAMYFQAVKTYGLDRNIPDRLLSAYHESMYKAAESSEMGLILPFDKTAQVDQPISLIAQSRNSFYNGRIDDAHVFLNQVKRLEPNMLEALLLEAEFDITEGKPDVARIVLSSLSADLSTPEWIRLFAEQLLTRIP